MKIYLKGYDYNDTLSTDFPMNAFQIQDTLDRMGGSTEVRFTISQFENMNLPQELCQKEFTADIYALNLFADRLEKMDSAENAAFISVLKSHPESRFDEMLEMTFGLDSVPVLLCKDYCELGEIAIENELLPELESCPEELLELLDREKIGQIMCERDGGIFVQGYYCVPSAYEPPDIEISIEKPERCFFRLLAAPTEQQAEWVTLPCEREKLFQLYDMNCCDFQSALPKIEFHDMHQIGALNELAEELSRLSLGNFVKLKAVMEAENITEISETIDCIKRLPQYDFHRNICDESDFGREYLMRNLPTDFRISALDGVDFFDFGMKITQLSGSAVTSYGAVSGRGQPLYSVLTVQPAEEECETEELEIGGMSL